MLILSRSRDRNKQHFYSLNDKVVSHDGSVLTFSSTWLLRSFLNTHNLIVEAMSALGIQPPTTTVIPSTSSVSLRGPAGKRG